MLRSAASAVLFVGLFALVVGGAVLFWSGHHVKLFSIAKAFGECGHVFRSPGSPATADTAYERESLALVSTLAFEALVVFESGQIDMLRSFIGCTHRHDPRMHVAVLLDHSRISEDEYQELSLIERTRLVTSTVDLTRWVSLELQRPPNRSLSWIDAIANSASGEIVLTDSQKASYFAEPDGQCVCHLQMHFVPMFRTSQTILRGNRPATAAASSTAGAIKKRWCMIIATYVSKKLRPSECALLKVFIPAFLRSIASSMSQYGFSVYLGTQVDPSWDTSSEMLNAVLAQLKGSVDLTVIRYPLHANLRDLVWKYNELARVAYQDGCDYIYQFSDDASILTEGWPAALAQFLDSHGGFGTVGMRDSQNSRTMTLGASGRLHMQIQGWFWPPAMKNWHADDFIHKVYGPRFSKRLEDYRFNNTQHHKRRYGPCSGEALLESELRKARQKAAVHFDHYDPAISAYLRTL